jgi:hypothetical protein
MFLFWGEGMAEVKEVKEELIYIVYKGKVYYRSNMINIYNNYFSIIDVLK